MKGDATCHTTNEEYRKGYDRIDWKGTRRVVPQPSAPASQYAVGGRADAEVVVPPASPKELGG